MGDMIDKAEALAPCPFCQQRAVTQDYGYTTELWSVSCVECAAQMERFATEAEAIAAWNRRAALPARGVGVPEIDGWVRRLRKTEEAGHVHHLSKADRLAIADFLAALAPTDAAQAPTDTRPANCRFRLKDEGKPYGRSSCSACGKSVLTGLGTSCTKGTTDAAQADDPECTDCGGTGITYQTERVCACQSTDAAHVNETPKSEHDAGNVLTDAALTARLREIQGQAGLFASTAAERIEALRAERDEHAEALKVNNAVLCDALLRIVAAEAVAEKLRAKIAAEARRYANIYDEGTDGRNTFTIFAEWVETRAALTTEADNDRV